MGRAQSFLAACLCMAALTVYFGFTSSPIKQVGDAEWDLKRPTSLPEVTLADVLRVSGSLADNATSKETELSNTEAKRPGRALPLLFCWSLMQLGGYEEALIKFQLQHRSSIFACDGFAVVSTKKSHIGSLDGHDVFTWENPTESVSKGQYGVVDGDGSRQTTNNWLNTATFLRAWDTLMRSKHFWSHDFAVKVDADSVFFPDRLRPHVQAHIGKPVYYLNCPPGGERASVALYGAVEVFSTPAMAAYHDRVEECKRLRWQGWGEDYYMDHCFAVLGVQAVMDRNQVGEKYCNDAPCSDWTKVAFHHFKDVESWERCYEESIGRS